MPDPRFTFMSTFMPVAAASAGVPEGVFARRLVSLFHSYCDLIQPTVALEIGAFEASFSKGIKQKLPDVRAVAFEANPHVYEKFREDVTAAGVEYLNSCVGPENQPVKLNVPRDFRKTPRDVVNQMASLSMNLNTENHDVVEVDGVRLDDFIQIGDDDRLVAWIDVEGACEMVLAGSSEVLSRASAVYIEVESQPMWDGQWLDVDVVDWFATHGLHPIARDVQRPQQYNLIFVSEELATDPAVARRAGRLFSRVDDQPAPAPAPAPASLVGKVRRKLKVRTRMKAARASLRRRLDGAR